MEGGGGGEHKFERDYQFPPFGFDLPHHSLTFDTTHHGRPHKWIVRWPFSAEDTGRGRLDESDRRVSESIVGS